MTAPRITAERIAEYRTYHFTDWATIRELLIALESAYAELDRLNADGMPRDREELQKLRNDAYRTGNQEAHEAHRLVREMGLSAQGGEVPPIPYEDAQVLKRNCKTKDHLIFGTLQWAREHARPAPPRPDTVDVPERAAWLTIDEMEHVIERGCGIGFDLDGRPMKRIPHDVARGLANVIASASMEKAARIGSRPAPPHPDTVEVSRRIAVERFDLENIRDNTLNPAHTMTKLGLEECMDLCHKIAVRMLRSAAPLSDTVEVSREEISASLSPSPQPTPGGEGAGTVDMEFLRIGYAWLDHRAGRELCSDRSCIRCRLADILFHVEREINALRAQAQPATDGGAA